MRVVVIGGGKVGGYLAKSLRGSGHGVIVIEQDSERARTVADETSALVIVGDGSDLKVLEEVNVERADWVLAVTGSDEINLVACQLARTAFGRGNLLARLNDPRNQTTFDALGVRTVSVTDIIAKTMSRELDPVPGSRIDLFGGGAVSLLEVEVPADGEELSVGSISLPESSVLVAIRRADGVVVPSARTTILPGDRVLAVTTIDQEEAVRNLVLGRTHRAQPARSDETHEVRLSIDHDEEP